MRFASTQDAVDRILRAISALPAGSAEAEKSLGDLLTENDFYGTYCELATYYWLARHNAQVDRQVKLTPTDILNTNPSELDGHFPIIDAYFDIKGMGFIERVARNFKSKLDKLVPNVTIDLSGFMDVSAKEIEAAFANINSVAADLKKNGAATIPDLGWNFHVRSAAPVTFTEQEHNAYRAAERNRCYPFKWLVSSRAISPSC